MPSRSPSPPRGGRGGDLDEPSMARLSLRRIRPYSPGRTAASMPAESPPSYRFQFPTSAQPSYASVVRRGLATVSQTHHQEESCLDSGFELDHRQEESCLDSEFELDSPPRLTIMNIPDEPHTPTSPPGSPPPPIDVDHSRFPTFGSDTEDDTEDDPYFKSLVDNFIIAAKDACKTSKDNIDKKAGSRRQSDRYAESVLKHYNNDKNNKVKYDLISAITSCAIIDMKGFFGHVNFIAKGNQQDSKEELFFAEVHLDHGTYVPTIVLSLEGMKKVGGLCESKYDNFNGVGFPFDAQHCYACGGRLKHPKNGALYEAGHIAVSDYYHG